MEDSKKYNESDKKYCSEQRVYSILFIKSTISKICSQSVAVAFFVAHKFYKILAMRKRQVRRLPNV